MLASGRNWPSARELLSFYGDLIAFKFNADFFVLNKIYIYSWIIKAKLFCFNLCFINQRSAVNSIDKVIVSDSVRTYDQNNSFRKTHCFLYMKIILFYPRFWFFFFNAMSLQYVTWPSTDSFSFIIFSLHSLRVIMPNKYLS